MAIQSTTAAKRILMIDDEVDVLEMVASILETFGIEVVTYSDPIEGEAAAIAERFDMIIIDIRMPNRNGAEITRNLLRARPEAQVLAISGHPGDPIAQEALRAGAIGLLRKPFEVAAILDNLGGSR